jgi:membrane associated rhomboid family serine protease
MPRTKAVTVITLLNAVIFVSWYLIEGGEVEGTLMFRHFLVSYDGLLEGRYWTLLTSVFSHISMLHFILNMYVLNNFGPILERVLGTGAFVRFYLIAGTISSLSHSLVSAFLLGKPELPALGASGAISGLIMVFSLLFPKQIMLLFGFVPVRALVGALAFVALDVWGLIVQAEGGGLPIGHGAHLGGAFCGLCYYFFQLRPRMSRRAAIW